MDKLYEISSKNFFPSDPATGTLGSINLNIYMMQVCGIPILGDKKETKQYQIFVVMYSMIYIIIMDIFYVGFEVYDLVLGWNNLNDLTEICCLLLPHIAGDLKLINVLYRRKNILRIISQFKLLTKKYVISEKQKEAFYWGELDNKKPLIMYIIIVTITCTTAVVNVMFDPENVAGKKFPFRVKLPDILPYSLRLTYMCMAIFFCGMQIVSMDYLNISLVNQIRYQVKILNLSFDSLSVAEEVDFNVNKYLSKLVEHHNLILEIRRDIENIFKFPVLLQFLTSLLIFALTGFQATVQSDSSGLIMIYCYCGGIFFELFVYCWFGNEVTEQSTTLASRAYNSSWYDFDQRYKKGLLIFLMNAQRPLYFTAGGFIDLSLATFTQILTKSYTFIAFLRQIYTDK